MRGKTVDVEFISDFIQECCFIKKTNPQDIINEARKRISQIDYDIKQVEELKLTRSKLNDVIASFSASENKNKKEVVFVNNNGLNSEFSREICSKVDNLGEVSVNDLLSIIGIENKGAIFIAIKKLSEMGIITRNSIKNIVPGPKWEDFLLTNDN